MSGWWWCCCLRVAGIAIARLCVDEVVVEEVIERVEGGPLVRILVPALEHHGIVGVRAQALWLGHPVAVLLDLVDDLRMSHARIGIGTERDQLVEQDAERPHVRLDGVGAQAGRVVDGEHLGRRPLDRKLVALVLRQLELVARRLQHLRESEVGYLDNVALADEYVARGQVAVHAPRALQVLHAAGDLRRHVDDLLEVEMHAVGLAHILEQRAVAHVLGDDEDRLADGAHAPELDELLVSQLLHDLELFAELLLARLLLLAVPLLLVGELERLDGDHEALAPQALVHLAEVAGADDRPELDVHAVLLPYVLEADEAGHLGARLGERATQAVGRLRVELHELVERVEAVARRYEAAARVDLAYAIVLGVALLLVVVVENGERPAAAVVLLRLAYEEHARLVVEVLEQTLGLAPRRARKEPLLDLQVVDGRDVVERHVAGLLGAHVLRQPPVRVALVDDDELVALAYGHVVLGRALVVEQRDVVGLFDHVLLLLLLLLLL